MAYFWLPPLKPPCSGKKRAALLYALDKEKSSNPPGPTGF